MQFTNNTNINLVAAAWLLDDNYDHVRMDNYFSATTLMKPVRRTALKQYVDRENQVMDVTQMVASAFGSAVHDSIEKTWRKDFKTPLRALGYPEGVISRIRVDPTDEELAADPTIIPIYFERRTIKQVTVDGVVYNIGGKFDLVTDGIINDFKTTGTFSYTKGGKDDDYILQLSIYRWLNPDLVTRDIGNIIFIFTDWQSFKARQDPNYPKSRIVSRTFQLLSFDEVERYVVDRIRKIRDAMRQDQDVMVRCTDKELWRDAPVFKYYADPNKMARATKNFDTLAEAQAYMAGKGGKGKIVTVPGTAKACGYCDVFEVCRQKDEYL